MSEIRSVSVHLDADVAGYIAKMKLAGAETDKAFSGLEQSRLTTLNRQLTGTSTRLDKVATSASKVTTEGRRLEGELGRVNGRVEQQRVKVDAGLRSIDKYSGRLGLLVSVLASLGPAAIPIAGVAVPAVTALGGSVVSLGLGAGVTELAFHGLGSTLQKFNKAAAEPTATNIAAAQQAMDKLPPSAQQLVLQLHNLTPVLDKLRQDAAGGLVPGVSDGLHSLLRDTPLVRQAVRGVSAELGQMAREGGQALASDQWRPFLRFAGQEAPVALHTLGTATGDVVHGLAQILMAFGPLNGQVDAGVLKLAQDFDRWASSMGRTKDFESFVAYIDTNGPRVVSLLGDVGQTFVDIVQAAAPLGGPTLQALDLLVKGLDALASSPLATPLLLLGQLYSVTRLVSSGYASIGKSASSAFGSKYLAGTKSAVTSLFQVTSAQDRARMSAAELAQVESDRAARNRATLLKGGAAVAGFALLASGTADKLGATNTATLALAGSMAGPLGAAVGGSIGAFIDWRSQMNASDEAIHRLESSASTFDISTISSNLDQLKAKQDAMTGGSFFQSVGAGFNITWHAIHGGTDIIDQQTQALVDAANAAAADRDVLTQLAGAYNDGKGPVDDFGRSMTLTNDQLAAVAARSAPAMQALGISITDLQQASEAGDGSLQHLVGRIVAWTNRADSASGRTDAVAHAFAAMGDQALTSDQRVQALSDSLDALLGPGLGLSAATDQWVKDLHSLASELSKTSKSLRGNSNAALQNRAAIRQRVSDLSDMVKAEATAGESPAKMTANLKRQRQALIDAGAAAGISRGEMRQYLNELGLTPKLIRTAIQLAGDQALNTVSSLNHQLAGLDGRVFHTTISVTRVGVSDLTATGGRVIRGQADGGTVTGAPRHPYGDKVIIAAAPGEEIITNRNGEADDFRRDRAAGMIPHYAAGGTVGGSSGAGAGASTSGARSELHRFQIALRDSTKALDTEKQHRQQLAQAQASLASGVRDNFRSDFLGVTPNGVWGAGSDPLSILRGDIRDARQFTQLDARLARRGASTGVLSQIGTLAQAQQVAGMSPAELRALNRLYAVRQRASQAAGNVAGDSVFGERLTIANHHLANLRGDVHRLTAQVKHLEHANAKAHDKNAHDVTKGINDGSKKAARRKR